MAGGFADCTVTAPDGSGAVVHRSLSSPAACAAYPRIASPIPEPSRTTEVGSGIAWMIPNVTVPLSVAVPWFRMAVQPMVTV